MKFRKRPVEVEATLWWRAGDHAVVVCPPPAHVPVIRDGRELALADPERAGLGAIRTLEGWMIVTPGDYIVCGLAGEHYACKPDIFHRSYEPVECAL